MISIVMCSRCVLFRLNFPRLVVLNWSASIVPNMVTRGHHRGGVGGEASRAFPADTSSVVSLCAVPDASTSSLLPPSLLELRVMEAL